MHALLNFYVQEPKGECVYVHVHISHTFIHIQRYVCVYKTIYIERDRETERGVGV